MVVERVCAEWEPADSRVWQEGPRERMCLPLSGGAANFTPFPGLPLVLIVFGWCFVFSKGLSASSILHNLFIIFNSLSLSPRL